MQEYYQNIKSFETLNIEQLEHQIITISEPNLKIRIPYQDSKDASDINDDFYPLYFWIYKPFKQKDLKFSTKIFLHIF